MSELSLSQIQEFYSHDMFATRCLKATVDSFEEGSRTEPYKATVSMDVNPELHLNAQGHLMGGVVMSLVDFALAVCSNSGQEPSCSVNHTVDIMNRLKGKRLIAKASSIKNGRSLSFYMIDVYDDLGTHIASAKATTMHTPGEIACGA